MKEKIALTITTLLISLLASQVVFSDDDGRRGGAWHRTLDVAPVSNDQYRQECASCHMAYPPGLLPAASWTRLMGQLADHFGDNAELPADTAKALTDYLVANAADRSDYRRSLRVTRSVGNNAPLRITEIPYIKSKHHEIPARLIKTNAKVGSLSNCSACHRQAESGSFSEREINIPGHGRWED